MGASTGPSVTMQKGRRRKIPVFKSVLILGVLPAALFAGWLWVTLHVAFSSGERAGYIQKLSHKGWICKTYEGELAITTYPGAAPEIFAFTVRDEAVAKQIDALAGQRVAMHYDQHRGIPVSCFGDTEYFITGVRVIAP